MSVRDIPFRRRFATPMWKARVRIPEHTKISHNDRKMGKVKLWSSMPSKIRVSCLRGMARPSLPVNRTFSASASQRADDNRPAPTPLAQLVPKLLAPRSEEAYPTANNASPSALLRGPYEKNRTQLSNHGLYAGSEKSRLALAFEPPHRFHVYATKHNTHITLTRPNSDPLISVAAGNIGFRKAGRGTYDAAYQLAAFVMSKIQEKGLLAKIQKLEVVLRGFGAGREAVTKAILGTEGMRLRGRVVRVTDATKLKFGGTRSPKPRRLG